MQAAFVRIACKMHFRTENEKEKNNYKSFEVF